MLNTAVRVVTAEAGAGTVPARAGAGMAARVDTVGAGAGTVVAAGMVA